MSAEAGSGQIEMPRSRPRLLPGLLGLVLVDAAVWSLGRFTEIEAIFLIGLSLILPIAYVVWLILRIRDLLQLPQDPHPLDVWVCQYSGPLALGMFALEFGCMALTNVLPEWGMLRRPGVFAILYHVAEWGLLFSCLCRWVRPHIGRAPKRVWRQVAVPLLVIFVLEFVLWAVFPAFNSNPDAQPTAALKARGFRSSLSRNSSPCTDDCGADADLPAPRRATYLKPPCAPKPTVLLCRAQS